MLGAAGLLLMTFIGSSLAEETCYPQRFEGDSVLCECNEQRCGMLGKIELERGHATVYQSTQAGDRFKKSKENLDSGEFGTDRSDVEDDLLMSLSEKTVQEIIGFGGAFTDSSGANWANLSEALRDRLLETYFSPEGSEYNMGRVPMGGCDFSLRDYTYDDTPEDLELKDFALQMEDLEYKIPMMKKSNSLAKEEIFYFGAPFSPPGWMKDTGKTVGQSKMKGLPGGEYYKAYAQYFLKFLEGYKENGIDIWGFTIQSEPTFGFQEWHREIMGLTPDLERDFIKLDLGPVLFNATDGKIKIMIFDDQRWALPWWTQSVYSDNQTTKYIAGIAVHWYSDPVTGTNSLEYTYSLDPSKFILNTESCEGFLDNTVIKGSWERGQNYTEHIIANLRSGLSGWVDWNLFLSMEGGPSWVNNNVDSAILIDVEKGAFYKQPMYYAMAHFSKFLPRGSKRIADKVLGCNDNLSAVTFLRPDGSKAAIILNKEKRRRTVKIQDGNRKLKVKVDPKAIASVVWK